MIKKIAVLVQIIWFELLTGCSMFMLPSNPQKVTEIISTPTIDISFFGKTNTCPGNLAVIKAFYDANDKEEYNISLNFIKPDAIIFTWGEGVNGRHWSETRITGLDNIKSVLNQRGFRRILKQPDSPIYHETEFSITNNQVVFYLRPDRLGTDGRPHNPYMVRAVMDDCKIVTLEIVERFTAP
jgi:hypothetical protein